MLTLVPDGIPFAGSWNYRSNLPASLQNIPPDVFNTDLILAANAQAYPGVNFGIVNNLAQQWKE